MSKRSKKSEESPKEKFEDPRIAGVSISQKELDDRIRQYNETRAVVPTNAKTFVESQTGDAEEEE